ncbi:MAG TPA: nicotinate phosphoribosyltransferase [Nitrospina sp.]|nr:nicotinate phosphoribosyltransferase [Nitrospina sp.]
MTQALKTDLYQLTMMQAYFAGNHNPYATFDYFVRNIPFGSYLVVAGLPSVLSYIEELRFDPDDLEYLAEQNLFTRSFLKYLENFNFTGDISGMPEGELAFPKEPILRVRAPIMEAQLIESFVLNKINFSSLIATKASRVVYAAGAKLVAEFGLRRAQGEAQLEATRACFIGGCSATSNVYAGNHLGIPVTGTMAHSYVTSFENETDAFRIYSETFPDNTILLIDTYDSLEGARKAVEIAKEMESRDQRLKAVRIDSGNLLELSKKVRNIFDKAGCSYVKIFASSDLNEWKIEELLKNGASIDAFGVGTEMITSSPSPALGGVYKLVEIEDADGNLIPKMKLSNDQEKATLPGRKTVWRLYDSNGLLKEDVIALDDEKIDYSGKYRKIHVSFVEKGQVVCQIPPLTEIRDQAQKNLSFLPEKYRAFDAAPTYPVKLSTGLEKLTQNLSRSLHSPELKKTEPK